MIYYLNLNGRLGIRSSKKTNVMFQIDSNIKITEKLNLTGK